MEPSDLRRKAREQKMARLRRLIENEGAELTNSNIMERMGVGHEVVCRVRKELGIPAPRSEHLTEDEVRKRGRYGGKRGNDK